MRLRNLFPLLSLLVVRSVDVADSEIVVEMKGMRKNGQLEAAETTYS